MLEKIIRLPIVYRGSNYTDISKMYDRYVLVYLVDIIQQSCHFSS